MVVYADVLFCVNLLADYALLLLVRRLLQLPAKPACLLLGAAVGALFAVVTVCVPMPAWGSFLLTFPAAFGVTAAAFCPRTRREWLRSAAGFYLAGFLFAGMLLAVWQVFRPPGLYIQNNVVYYPVPLPVFFILLCGLYGVSSLLAQLLGGQPSSRLFCRVKIRCNGAEATLRAKLDTGCALREPFSGRPVLLASAAALGEVLPAFFPDTALDEQGRPLVCCVAVSPRPIGGTGFSAVMNPTLLREEE